MTISPPAMWSRPRGIAVGAGRDWSSLSRVAGGLLVVAANAVAAAVASTIALVLILSLLFDGPTVTIDGDSMKPSLDRGDILIARSPDAVPKEGEIIVFYRSGRGSGEGIVTHRVVGETDTGEYRTRGDANDEVDSSPVPAADIAGRAAVVVPYAGLLGEWWRSGRFVIAIGVATLLLIALSLALKVNPDA